MQFRSTDASRLNVSAQCVQGSGATNVCRRDVAGLGVHLHAVAARHGDLKLHPELRIRGACRLRGKHPGNLHSRGERLRLEGIRIEQLLSGCAASIGFDMYGVTHGRCGASFKLDDVDRAEIRRQPQCQAISGAQHAIAHGGRVLRARLRGPRIFEGRRFFGIAGKDRLR